MRPRYLCGDPVASFGLMKTVKPSPFHVEPFHINKSTLFSVDPSISTMCIAGLVNANPSSDSA